MVNKWRSGKRLTAERIAKLLPDHDVYVEPFAGRASVFFKKDPAKKEVIADKDCQIIKDTRKTVCSLEANDKCDRLKTTKVECGKDYTYYLKKYDSPRTLFYLDPPYEDRTYKAADYNPDNIKLDDVLKEIKKLKGKVALSYSAKPEYRNKICKNGFKCRTLKLNAYSHWTKELLGIKK